MEKLINYNEYKMNWMEKIGYSILSMVSVFIILMLFYNNIYLSSIGSLFGLLAIPYLKKYLIKKRKKILKNQFKEALYSLSSSIASGRSVEKAFQSALEDLKLIYNKDNTYIINEFEIIVRKLMMNETIEEAFQDFSKRAQDEDITNFSNVFITAKRSGGNMLDIMRHTSRVISEKIEISNTIDVIITQKKYEQKILTIFVPLIIVYLNTFSDGFLQVMYTTLAGKVLMTIALVLYIISIILGNKIVDIEV